MNLSSFGRRWVTLPNATTAGTALKAYFDTLYVSLTTARREVLTANRTYYARSDGSDSNTGLVDSAGGAFLTLQKAVDTVAALDIQTFTVTIQARTATFASVTVTGPWVGSGTVILLGDTTTPANVLINSAGNCITVQKGGRLNVRGLKLTAGSIGLYANSNGTITVDGLMDFGACSSYHAYATTAGSILFTSSWNTTGGAFASLGAQSGGVIDISSRSTTVTNTPAWASAYCSISLNALLIANAYTFSGAATGSRYSASTGGGVFTASGPTAAYFPGNAAGTATAPGWAN